MAYVSQELKQRLQPIIKNILKKYNVKGTISVRHKSTLVVTIRSGELDLASTNRLGEPVSCYTVNEYGLDREPNDTKHQLFRDLYEALNDGNWNKSDIQTDYFNVGWYTYVCVGEWNKPYVQIK